MHAFPNWYKYYTKSILGDEFAYPFEEPPVQFVQRPFFFINSYCWHVVQNNGEITRRFLAAYKDFHLVEGPSSAVVSDEPEVHFIAHPLDLAFIPNFTVFHAPTLFNERVISKCSNSISDSYPRLFITK